MQLYVFHVINQNTQTCLISRTMHSGDADTTCNITSQNYPTQKIAEKQIETQRRSFDPPHHLKSRVPYPFQEYTQPIKIPYQLGSPCLVPSNQDSKNTQLYMIVV